MEGMRCALCGAGADVHCAADAAFLCAPCDAQVHGANFLASRHRRTRVSAPKDVCGTSSSSCLSTADSATTAAAPHRRQTTKHTRTRRTAGEVVIEGWAKRMRVVAPRRLAAAAARAFQDVPAAPRVPLRVAMAAALWRKVAAQGVHGAAGDALRRLEACARVPARLVVAMASSMGRARVKRAAASDTEEARRAGASTRESSDQIRPHMFTYLMRDIRHDSAQFDCPVKSVWLVFFFFEGSHCG
jgi:hypothetical protein